MTSCNSKILTIQHLRSVVTKLEVLLFTRKKASSMKQEDLREMFKKASKNVCSTTAAPSPDPLTPTTPTSSAIKTPANTEENYDDLEQEDGSIQTKHSSE
jgi:hypothetical protein